MKIEEEIKQPTFKSEHQKAHINLLYTSGWVQQAQASLFKPFGVTLPQYNVLRILRGQHPKPATISLLIDRMLDKTSNASRIVDKLEAKALVTRKQCPADRRTVDVLLKTVPAAVPGIAFLSGGQSDEEATAHLSAMNRIAPLPWKLTFSYGRALQTQALVTWNGDEKNVPAAQQAFTHRARMNALASLGEWQPDLDQAA